ncbi:hypothetical protein [Nocardioides litoris]|uniref:hypothetical protein n=1 Tax=Nocardioides litoris TaxID=1926648 RepID=UPI0011237BA6|nr:hypothetical protein [Nocardioides litoris]
MEKTPGAWPLGLAQWLRWADEVGLEPRRLVVEQVMAWPGSEVAEAEIDAAVDCGLLSAAEQHVITLRRVGVEEQEAYAGWDGSGRVMVIDARWVSGLHPTYQCAGRGCWIHHPSSHGMAGWPATYCDVHAVAHRVCTHWHLHPDPDDAAYRRSLGDDWVAHGCRCAQHVDAGRWSPTACPCACCEGTTL